MLGYHVKAKTTVKRKYPAPPLSSTIYIKESHEYFPKHNHPNFHQKEPTSLFNFTQPHKGQGKAICQHFSLEKFNFQENA